MCFYYYSVKIYDDYDIVKENGYTVGANYQEAMKNLTDYYGGDNVIKATLEYVADRPVLILPEEGAITAKGLTKAIKDNNDI